MQTGIPGHDKEEETESLLKAAQNNTIRTNYIKVKIDNKQQNRKCWSHGDRDVKVDHIIRESRQLGQKE